MRMGDLKAGWAVVGNDGRRLGTVQHADQDYLLVSRGAFSDLLYVPASAIANVEHELVHLNLAKSEAEHMGWEQRPRDPDGAAPVRQLEPVDRATPAPPRVTPAPAPARATPAPASATPDVEDAGLSGIHVVVFTPAVAELRTFFRDTLGMPHVDAADGWPIFALPPAELAVHPAEVTGQEIYLMCENIEATLASLERKGVAVRRPVREEAWGFVAALSLPGGTDIAIYQPRHPSPLSAGSPRRA